MSMALHGWVCATLWGWFVVPLGMPPITFWHAVGLSGFVNLMTYRYSSTPKDEEEKPASAKAAFRRIRRLLPHALGTAVAGPLFVWGVGYLIHTYGM